MQSEGGTLPARTYSSVAYYYETLWNHVREFLNLVCVACVKLSRADSAS